MFTQKSSNILNKKLKNLDSSTWQQDHSYEVPTKQENSSSKHNSLQILQQLRIPFNILNSVNFNDLFLPIFGFRKPFHKSISLFKLSINKSSMVLSPTRIPQNKISPPFNMLIVSLIPHPSSSHLSTFSLSS